jgi:site-specific DNA-methyltransferase (adenine-specific)
MPRQGRRPGQEALFESRNLLYYGDNLPVLREHIRDETVDLVYLDPPFNSGQDYNIPFKERDGTRPTAQIKAFKDTWTWDQAAWESYQEIVRGGPPEVSNAMQAFHKLVPQSDMLAYLSMMAPRLVRLRQVLKPTGSIYLHCDPTASHYLKLLMDAVFGTDCFRNEIIWHYRKWPSGRFQFQRNHDVVLFYSRSKSRDRTFNQLFMQRAPSTLKRFGTAKILSGHDEAGKRIPSTMAPEDSAGVRRDDVWDIGRVPPIKQWFPTEKPAPLLERIIDASSKPGDLVLDPFCGCGTTITVAHRLRRRWIGIDITKVAIDTIKERLEADHGASVADQYEVRPEPATVEDARALAAEDKLAFEAWALRRVGAQKSRPDRGVDGRMYYFDHIDGETKLIVVSVKGGGIIRDHIISLRGAMEREHAAIGVFVTKNKPTPGMKAEAAEAGTYYSGGLGRMVQRLQILTVEDLFDPEKKKRPVDFPAEAAPLLGAPGLPEAISTEDEAERSRER